jgi:hypothetical protein
MRDFGFHDLRHFFISQCVMFQIDFLTIARWVGHRDGGVLIGRTYPPSPPPLRYRLRRGFRFKNEDIKASTAAGTDRPHEIKTER